MLGMQSLAVSLERLSYKIIPLEAIKGVSVGLAAVGIMNLPT